MFIYIYLPYLPNIYIDIYNAYIFTYMTCLNFRVRILCLVKKKKKLDLQVFSQIDKTMKRLQ